MHALAHHCHADGSLYPKEQCQIYVAIRKGEGTHVADEVVWRHDGTSFPVEYWSYPMHKDGKLVGAVVTFLDISNPKLMQRATAGNFV
jgi:PAS domain S-box-containing protein